MLPQSTEGNPLLELFWRIIPHPYWYMYAAIPLIVLYLGLVWCIAKPAARRNRGKTEDELATVK